MGVGIVERFGEVVDGAHSRLSLGGQAARIGEVGGAVSLGPHRVAEGALALREEDLLAELHEIVGRRLGLDEIADVLRRLRDHLGIEFEYQVYAPVTARLKSMTLMKTLNIQPSGVSRVLKNTLRVQSMDGLPNCET